MAVIDKKLIHFTNLATFEQRLDAGDIKDTSIVFIQDAKRIWTHGQYYSSSYTQDEIKLLFNGSSILLTGYSGEGVIQATDTINEAFNKLEEILEPLSDLNAILVDTDDIAEDPLLNDYISPRPIKDIKDKNTGLLVYPKTHIKAVAVTENVNLDKFIEKIDEGFVTAEYIQQVDGLEIPFITKSEAQNITDAAIADLVGLAPETLDTIYEIADALQQNQNVVDALNNAIVNKLTIDGTVTKVTALTQAEYDALDIKNPTTLYIITDD